MQSVINTVKKNTQSRTTILYYENVDSDGLLSRYEFSRLIAKTGQKTYYRRAHEWCCGHGAMGFQLLEDGLCQNLVLSDKFEPAIESCKFTTTLNDLQKIVTMYHNDNLEKLPMTEQWDLFISNPPWSSVVLPGPELSDDKLRIKFDLEWQAHNMMFKNISKHLTADADVYLYEDLRYSNEHTWEQQIKDAGLFVHGVYTKVFVVPTRSSNYVLHLRKL